MACFCNMACCVACTKLGLASAGSVQFSAGLRGSSGSISTFAGAGPCPSAAGTAGVPLPPSPHPSSQLDEKPSQLGKREWSELSPGAGAERSPEECTTSSQPQRGSLVPGEKAEPEIEYAWLEPSPEPESPPPTPAVSAALSPSAWFAAQPPILHPAAEEDAPGDQVARGGGDSREGTASSSVPASAARGGLSRFAAFAELLPNLADSSVDQVARGGGDGGPAPPQKLGEAALSDEQQVPLLKTPAP